MNINTEDYKLELVSEAMKVYESLPTIDIDIKIDLDRALTSTLLTAGHRKVLFAINNLELNFMQTTKLLGYELLEVQDLLVEATEIITAVMNGRHSEYHSEFTNEVPDTLDDFLVALDLNTVNPLTELTDELQYSVLTYMKDELNDKLSKEVLRQQTEGMPQHVHDELFNAEYSKKLYNSYKVSDRIEQGKHENRVSDDKFARQAIWNKIVYMTDETERYVSSHGQQVL